MGRLGTVVIVKEDRDGISGAAPEPALAHANGQHSSAGHTLKWMEHQLDLIGSKTS